MTIPAVFRAVARARPDAVAVCAGTARLTYRELDERSDETARGLLCAGVASGDRVGVLLDRDERLIVVLLAILKAGAAYVPLDGSHPPGRRAYMMAQASVRTLVTVTPSDVDSSRAGPGRRTPDELAALGAASDRPLPDPFPDACAYVIFTSGSSGRPKGVMVPHRNVVALVRATTGLLRLSASDVWTMYHSAAFDFSVWEMFGCLLTGGRLVVVPFWTARSPAEFHALLVTEQVTILNQTPSAFGPLIAEDREQPPSRLALRLVVFGGEPLPVVMLADWFERHPPAACRLVNMYGITETTVHVTAADIGPDEVRRRSRSVGRALPGWSVSVRDENGAVLPDGVAGEIHVGGAGVAAGYVGAPEMSAARFLADAAGERRYRSGDLGRVLPDGTLEHLGRIDHQVKLRGHRIELDEIRSVLLEAAAVVDAAVVLRPGQRATIDAYVVLRPGYEPPDVRDTLAAMLPDYMIPTSITPVDAIPLNANGKLDRGRLPAPAHPREARRRGSRPPRQRPGVGADNTGGSAT